MTWVFDNLDLIVQLSIAHLRQSAVAIALGLILSIPLGFAAWRFRLLGGGVIAVTGILYTIPSLALLVLLPAAFGYPAFSDVNLVIALTLYAIAVLVRSVVDGLDAVDPGVRAASTAVGYSASRRFFAVELPLAAPVILAGLRVTAASTISLATVGILVGVPNLGYLFTNGLERRIIPEVLTGVLAVIVLALLIDAILVITGRVLMPWARPRRSADLPTAESGTWRVAT
jgi:osmoprotectant transport system permease protein